MTDYSTYNSPLADRYKNDTLLRIWSREYRAIAMVRFWLYALVGLPKEYLSESTIEYLDKLIGNTHVYCKTYECPPWLGSVISKAVQIERTTRHETVALLDALIEVLPEDAAKMVHRGMTSSDPEDFSTSEQIRTSMTVVFEEMASLLASLDGAVHRHSDTVIMGRTHLQLAEPTTLGYRLLVYAEQFREATKRMRHYFTIYPIKVQLGAVGTNAGRKFFLDKGDPAWMNLGDDARRYSHFGFTCRPLQASGQTYPRQIELRLLQQMSDMACTIFKLGLDVRLMFDEPWMRRENLPGQVGSSAMPGKVNPLEWENACSLARMIPNIERGMWDLASQSALERTLDDSASRRMWLPESFMVLSACLRSAISGMKRFDDDNLDKQFALEQVWESWKSWLPSRVLVRVATPGNPWAINRTKLHGLISQMAEGAKYPLELWHEFLPDTPEEELSDIALLEANLHLDYPRRVCTASNFFPEVAELMKYVERDF